jgi:asparaginyl-tRNA synthetase
MCFHAMEKEVTIERVAGQNGKKVRLTGWLYNKRSSGKISFVLVRDGTGIIQGVLVKGETPDLVFQALEEATQESSIEIEGLVREDKRSPLGYELGVTAMKVLSRADEYPISKKDHGPDFLLSNRHLWIRSKLQHAILRVRHTVIQGIHEFLNDNGFLQMDAPIFTPSACEGTSTLFEVKYFDDKAYLTQSGQLYGEAGAMAFRRIYTFGPTFRAEKSKTRRHLTEFWMVEPEMAFCDLNQNMDMIEGLMCHIVQKVVKERRIELIALERDVSKLENVRAPFPRITYDDAAKVLEGHPDTQFKYGTDFGGPDETILASRYDRPFFVSHFPAAFKAFYMKRPKDRPDLTLSCDLLAPEGYGEIVGGSQREEDIGALVERMREHKLPQENYEWYLDLRRFGSVPHSGFGLGVERTVAWICGTQHIRECIPFPRMLYRIYP